MTFHAKASNFKYQRREEECSGEGTCVLCFASSCCHGNVAKTLWQCGIEVIQYKVHSHFEWLQVYSCNVITMENVHSEYSYVYVLVVFFCSAKHSVCDYFRLFYLLCLSAQQFYAMAILRLCFICLFVCLCGQGIHNNFITSYGQLSPRQQRGNKTKWGSMQHTAHTRGLFPKHRSRAMRGLSPGPMTAMAKPRKKVSERAPPHPIHM